MEGALEISSKTDRSPKPPLAPTQKSFISRHILGNLASSYYDVRDFVGNFSPHAQDMLEIVSLIKASAPITA